MRREVINYIKNFPIDIRLMEIEEYPIHWHQTLEIFMVLKGSVNVSIESDEYELVEGEIAIVNVDETHRLYSNKDNLILMFHIDINYFQKYYDDIKNIYFYTDCASEGNPQVEKKYEILKQYLSIIAFEMIQQKEDYDLYIKKILVKLLYLLINDFHYLIYENRDLKDNQEQLQRYHRIAKYIYNNYNNKISLKDIAEKEFLNAQYLSNEIKNSLGTNFKDFVNLTRVEESVKLLLDTNMTISEISEEVGFSHIRYYNKSFKKYFKMTPRQYRKKYQVSSEKRFEEIKKIQFFDLKNALEYIIQYLRAYSRFNSEEKTIKIYVNAAEGIGDFYHEYKNTIILPRAYKLLESDTVEALKSVQKEIGFEYGKIVGLFSKEMGIGASDIINLKKIKQVIDLILSLDLRPDIVFEEHIQGNTHELITSFLQYFAKEYSEYEISQWKYSVDSNTSKEFKEVVENILSQNGLSLQTEIVFDVNCPYDTPYMAPYIIYRALNHKSLPEIKVIDEPERFLNLDNTVFFGDNGILSWEGIKKPSYYALFFLSKLGNTVVDQAESYIVTSYGEDIQVLLYNTSEDSDVHFSLNITNLLNDYKITKYEIEETNNCYNMWKALGNNAILDDEELELLKSASAPKISLGFRKKQPLQHLDINIKGYGATLILFKAVR